MKHPCSPFIALSWSLVSAACNQGGDAGAGAGEPGTAGSSPPTTSTDPTTIATPTTTGATSPATAGSTSTSTSSEGSSAGGGSTSAVDTATNSTSSSSGTAGDVPSSSCGDGKLDPGEQCDAGAAELDDEGACTLECQAAKCGDQLVWEGKEACDDGPNNNDNLYGACTTQCQFGARCNDGLVQGPEECDLGDDNGSGEFPPYGVPCDNGCRFQARLAFVSSVAYKGGDLGGVEGAHLKCQNLAKQAGFDNSANFRAWLSDAQHSPFQDFNHAPETTGLPYVRPDGVRVADDWDDLILNGPGDGIVVTDTGEKLLSAGVWTGTAPSGKVFDPSATCKSWSSSAAADKSRAGLSDVAKQQPQEWMQWMTEKEWTSKTSFGCYLKYRIYCFEQ